MDTNTKYSIFISYSTENESLISKLVDFLKNSLGLDKKDIFCTVDFRSITTGDKFHDKIFNSIRNSQICISVITPQSAYDPWVLCESGGAYTHYIEDEKRFRACLCTGHEKK
jgi:hypothetical protein